MLNCLLKLTATLLILGQEKGQLFWNIWCLIKKMATKRFRYFNSLLASLIFLFLSCQEKIDPVMKIEANLNTPFVVSAPAEITFKEIGSTLHIVRFSNYVTFGTVLGATDATVVYADQTYEITNIPNCEQCPRMEIAIGSSIRLVYDKVVKESCVKSFGIGKCEMKIDSAQFILKSGI